MNWRFCIDSLQQRALAHCYGSMDEGDGYGNGWGNGRGGGWGGGVGLSAGWACYGDPGDAGFGDVYGDGYGNGTGDGDGDGYGYVGNGGSPAEWK